MIALWARIPAPVKTPPKEKAKALYMKGVAIAEIARRLRVNRSTVTRWKRDARGTADDWDRLRDSLPEPEPAPRSPKLVNFERPPERRRAEQVDLATIGDLNTLEGQLALIDKTLEAAFNNVRSPASPQEYSASLNAVPKLLAERRAILPINRVKLALTLMELYRDPAELLEVLQQHGFGRRSA